MPLRAWYPLNGNTNNMGASNLTLTQTTAPAWSTGKTSSQAMTTGAFKWTAAQSNSIFNNNEFSYACWFYVDAASGTSASDYKKIFGAEGGTNSMNRKFTCGQYPKVNDLHISSWNGSSLINCGIIEGVLPSYAWTHICYSYKKGAINIYINGVLKKTTELTMANSSYSAETPVLWNYSGRRICDVRVYDHALSQKEVAELAKGMMIHYTLDNPYSTGVLNFYSGERAHGNSDGQSYTKTKLANEDGYNFKLNRTGDGSSIWPNVWFNTISRTNFVAGRKYTWSAKVRCNTWTAGYLTLRNSIASNDWQNGGVTVCSPELADGQWHQYSRTITLTEGMHIGSTYYYLTDAAYNASTQSSKGYMAPNVEFFCGNQNGSGTVYNMDFDIKEVQLIESDSFPGWVDNTMASNTVRDNTGRGNDATCSGSVTTEGGSPRNTRAFKLLDTSYVQYPVPSGISQCTIAFWVKRASGGGYSTVDCLKNNPGGSMWLAVNTESNKLWAYWGGTYNRVSGSLTANTWYHVALTFNAGVTQWYLDGVAVGSAVDFSARGTTWPSGTRTIGNSYTGSNWNTKFNGAFSDWRFYTTVLTAAQIKELYNAPISVANTGACLSEQFTEGASGISFAKTGVVSCNGISSLPGKYDPEVLIEPDGSCWAHIGHHADPTTYKFASSDPFSTGVWKDDRRFLDPSFCDNVDKWEFLIVQKADASATTYRYRWSQTKNPNTAVYEDVPSSAVTKNTGTGYTTFSTGGIYKFNSSAYYVTNNGSKGNWWGAIGAWGAHQGGIPGWAGTVVKDGGFLDLYIRIDNVTFTNGRTGCSLDKAGKAVLSPEFIEQ